MRARAWGNSRFQTGLTIRRVIEACISGPVSPAGAVLSRLPIPYSLGGFSR